VIDLCRKTQRLQYTELAASVCPLGLHLRSARMRVLSDSNHSLSTGLQPGHRPFEKQTAQVLPLLVTADPFSNILAARASRKGYSWSS
jgi:hypothetical protein